eukprot:161232_1
MQKTFRRTICQNNGLRRCSILETISLFLHQSSLLFHQFFPFNLLLFLVLFDHDFHVSIYPQFQGMCAPESDTPSVYASSMTYFASCSSPSFLAICFAFQSLK